MVWVVGILGFIVGFMASLAILRVLLKDKSNEELLNDRALRWTYGLLVWLLAAIASYGFVASYQILLM